jgi:hypothetical protein
MTYALALFGNAEQTALSLVERYGSFGLLVVLFVGFTFYVIPKTIAAFREQSALFQTELKAERTSREEQHEKCEATHKQTTQVLGGMAAQIQRLADRTEEYRPLKRRGEEE